ncbi:MAG: hypothetical protein H6720_28780 [Sandaracinus sp.]|nr:hypothetical protein [Sandaracinus sp.]
MSFDDFDDPLDPLAMGELPGLELAQPAPTPTAAKPSEDAPPPPKPKKPEETIRPADVRALAGFPDPPGNPLSAILYLLTVFPRRRELLAKEKDLAARLSVATRKADQALAELGEVLLGQRATLEAAGLAGLLRVVTTELGEHDAKSVSLRAARERVEKAREEAATSRAEAETVAAPLRDKEAKLATEADALTHERRRADAALQRVEIELRNLGGDPASRAPLEPALAARRSEAEIARRASDLKNEELKQIRGRLNEALDRIRRADALLQELGKDLEGDVHQAARATGEAGDRLRKALRDLAEAALAGNATDGGSTTRRAKSLCDERDEIAKERMLHERAAGVYDEAGYLQGQVVVGLVGLLVVVAVLVAIF